MFKKHLYIVIILAFISHVGFAQKAQRLAYIDMAFVLENIPDYVKAQDQLNIKVKGWQKRLEREKNEIESLKKDFSNEKALLTLELIQEREDDIYYKELEYNQLQHAYFGPKGDLYLYRKLLVQPIQDKVYNAIQGIAVKKRYDFVIDKSSDLILLYSNKRYDISDLVVNSIVRTRKQKALQAKRKKSKKAITRVIPKKKNIKKQSKSIVVKDVVSGTKDTSIIVDSITTKTTALKKDETLTNKVEETENLLKDTPSKEVLERIEKRNDKRKIMLEKIRLAKEAKDKKKETGRKAAADKRAKRLKEINKYKEELNRKRDSAQQVKKDKKAKKDETKDN